MQKSDATTAVPGGVEIGELEEKLEELDFLLEYESLDGSMATIHFPPHKGEWIRVIKLSANDEYLYRYETESHDSEWQLGRLSDVIKEVITLHENLGIQTTVPLKIRDCHGDEYVENVPVERDGGFYEIFCPFCGHLMHQLRCTCWGKTEIIDEDYEEKIISAIQAEMEKVRVEVE